MKISLTARHFELTDAIKHYVNDKLAYLAEHIQNIIEANIILEVEKNPKIIDNQIIEIHIHAPKVASEDVHCKIASPDLYKSIDEAIHKTLKILQKEKDKTLKA